MYLTVFKTSLDGLRNDTVTGADPGFQVRGGGGGALKKIAQNGGRRENFWGISCEKSRFYTPPLDPPLSNFETTEVRHSYKKKCKIKSFFAILVVFRF